MRLYRYRTTALFGPWRESRMKAAGDAVAAGQAEWAEGDRLDWQVEGEIEVAEAEAEAGVSEPD